jgi:hypothetical protein
MIQIILYDNWLEEAQKKIRVGKKMVPKMSKMQIRELLKLCTTAYHTEFLSFGTLHQIK